MTRSEGEVHLHKLDHHIRAELDATSRRSLAVLRPLRLVIANLPDAHYQEVEAKVGPGVACVAGQVVVALGVAVLSGERELLPWAAACVVAVRQAAATFALHSANAARPALPCPRAVLPRARRGRVQGALHQGGLHRGGWLGWAAAGPAGKGPTAATPRRLCWAGS